MKHAIISAVLAVSTATPAIATIAPAQSSAKNPDKQICRRVMMTGSNFGKRVCFSRAEWKQLHDRDVDNAAKALSNRTAGTPKEIFGPGS